MIDALDAFLALHPVAVRELLDAARFAIPVLLSIAVLAAVFHPSVNRE
jgi:hypothetical protein